MIDHDLRIEASAPIRVCDLGGWTDTWFARRGRVVNIGVSPRVHVKMDVRPTSRPAAVVVTLQNYRDQLEITADTRPSGPHQLIEAAVVRMFPTEPCSIDMAVRSDAPPGAATGTSASVCVAVLGALAALRGEGAMTPEQLAGVAHRVETDDLGAQSGIQDQLCAAHGGVIDIEIDEYPRSQQRRIALADTTAAAIDSGLSLIYLGRPHASSAVHHMVIAGLERTGPDTPALEDLRSAARRGVHALTEGDLVGFGQAMKANTTAQRALHPGLVSPQAEVVGRRAEAFGALGWKVNGAGGDGGSLSILFLDPKAKREFESAIASEHPSIRAVPTAISSGVEVAILDG
ncbi:MAG: GHMP kinase [Acidimicrobiales bacterium]